MTEAIELLQVYVKGLERKLDAERALADDLAAVLAGLGDVYNLDGSPNTERQRVLARHRQARSR